MKKYLAILRGINVGGKRKLLMADLKLICEEIGWTDLQTYIQSGNVLFNSKKEIDTIAEAKKLEKKIKSQYNYDVPVIIISIKALEVAAKKNPFIKSKDFDIKQMHLTFLSQAPEKAPLKEIKEFQYPPDEYKISGLFVYVKVLTSYHKTKVSNGFFEKKLKVKASTRNWKTVSKLLELANEN